MCPEVCAIPFCYTLYMELMDYISKHIADVPPREKYSNSSNYELPHTERPDSNLTQQPVDILHAAGSSIKFPASLPCAHQTDTHIQRR